MKKILDHYFYLPLIWDFIISFLLVILFLFLKFKHGVLIINISDIIAKDLLNSLVSITVTLSGFLITILTIVVTFKNTIDEKKILLKSENIVSNESNLEVFFSSNLYFKSVKLITQGIIEYGAIFLLLIFLQLNFINISTNLKGIILISCVLCLSLVFIRCLYILSQIIHLQKLNSTNL